MTKFQKSLSGILLSLLFLLAGCGKAGNLSSGEDEQGKLVVFTSFYPMYDFVAKIGGEEVVVYNMVPAGVEPHSWEPTTADMVGLEKADVFVYSGAGMEHWVESVLSNLENQNLVVVEASKGFSLLKETCSDPHHNHGDVDPHVWLSPQGAAYEMEQIRDGLIQADPDHASVYEANCDTWTGACRELADSYEQKLKTVKNHGILVSHASFGYLCHDYGLTQMAAQGFSAEGEPDPARMAELVRYAREQNVQVVFYDPGEGSKVAQSIARELDASVAELNPLEFLTQEQMDAGEDYFSVMQKNLDALVDALER